MPEEFKLGCQRPPIIKSDIRTVTTTDKKEKPLKSSGFGFKTRLW